MTTATIEEVEDTQTAHETGAAGDEARLLYLLPEDFEIDPAYDVRPWSTEHKIEDTEIASLADKILALGQLDSLIVLPKNANGKYPLLAGHRRRLAVVKINKERRKGSELMRLRCVVKDSTADNFAVAVSSNRDRENPTPMDVALLIKKLRPTYGAEAKGSADIAKVLGLKSKANVTQHERLLTDEFSDAIREQLHEGTISMDSAFDFAAAGIKEPTKVAAIVEKAKKIQEKAEIKDIEEKAKKGKIAPSNVEPRKAAAKEKKRVERPAVRKAIRDANPEAKMKRTLKDVKTFFGDMAGDYAVSSATGKPKYGYPDGGVQLFLAFFMGWVDGDGADSTLQKKFDEMVAKAEDGTKAALAALREKEEREEEQKKKERAKVRAAKAEEKKAEEEKAEKKSAKAKPAKSKKKK